MASEPTGTPLQKFPEPEYLDDPIPAERYTSPEFAAREWKRMWTRTWQIAGPESDVAKVGDYFTFEIGHESILVVRSAPDELSAFYNVCQHRASQIVTQRGCGHARAFTCPYHLWSYDLEGRLRGLPDRDDFRQGIPEGMRIPAVRVDTWGGWVWINMNPDAEPLGRFLRPVVEHLDPYDFGASYALTRDVTFDWACNWKVAVDAFNEVYHVAGIHPELIPFTDDVDCPIDLLGKHSRFLFHVGRPSPRWTDQKAHAAGYPDRRALTQELRGLLQAYGVDAAPFERDSSGARGALIRAQRELGEQKGWNLSALNDEQLWIDVHYQLFPNVTLNISVGHFWFFRARPHPDDPNRMFWDFQEYHRMAPGGPRPQRPEHVHSDWGGEERAALHLALRQDGDTAPPQQRGLRSRGFRGLHLAHQERRIRHFHHVLDGYLGDGR